jgi:hypothetical protein
MSKKTEDWMVDLVKKYSVPSEEALKPKSILTEEQIKRIKDGNKL